MIRYAGRYDTTYEMLRQLVGEMRDANQFARAQHALDGWKDAAEQIEEVHTRRFTVYRHHYLGNAEPFFYRDEEYEVRRTEWDLRERMLEFETVIRSCAIISDLDEIDARLED